MHLQTPEAQPLPSPRGLRLPSQGALLGIVVTMAALAGLGYWGVNRLSPTSPAIELVTAPVARQDLVATVSSTGTVISTATSRLAFKASGRIADILVSVGDQVQAGQILARQDLSDVEPAVLQAEANLRASQAKLALVLEGARPEDVIAARASLDASEAKLAQMRAGSADEELAAADAALESAEIKLQQLLHPNPRDVEAAQAAVESAQAALDKLRAGPTAADIVAAQAGLAQAHASRAKNTASMAAAKDNPNQKPTDQPTLRAAMAADDAALNSAQAKLDQLLAGPTAAEIAAGESALKQAQLKLDTLLNPSEADLAAARSAVRAAQNTLSLKQNPFSEADFLAQHQAVKQAEANLVAKRQPYQNSDILAAQAGVVQAQANVATAQTNLSGATLIAPFDGVVSATNMSVGETATTTGANPSSITVVDPPQLRVDVQVDEADIARIAVGQPARLTFDALPGRTVRGNVIAIAPSGTLTQGVVGYPVSIGVQNARGVRPGMTAVAEVEYERRTNALVLPNRAIIRQGRERFVQVMISTGPERRRVQVGMANDEFTEITEGLQEGDTVVVPQTTARAAVPGLGGGTGGGFGGGFPGARPGGGGGFVAPAP